VIRQSNCSTVWLVRHGESTWNALGLVQGHANEPTLTNKGRLQSLEAADTLRGHPIAAVYASDLERARQTASYIAPSFDLPILLDDALRERCFGQYEGRPLHSLRQADSGIEGEHVTDATARPDGGESLNDLYQRAWSFMDWLRSQPLDGEAIVVTHGGMVRAIRACCAGYSMSECPWDAVPNGSVWPVKLGPPANARFSNDRNVNGGTDATDRFTAA
jgi:2,3-bisphosphoglycerate-dependent phosphoglycerate mutase